MQHHKPHNIMKKTLTVLLAVLLAVMTAAAQTNVKVTGSVKGKTFGEPLPGVAVTYGDIYTITDNDGNYSIEVPSGAELTFSMTGMKTLKVNVAGGVNSMWSWRMKSSNSKRRS